MKQFIQVKKLSAEHCHQVFDVLSTHSHQDYFLNYGLNWSLQQITQGLAHLAWGGWFEHELVSFVILREINNELAEIDLMAVRLDMLHKNYMSQVLKVALSELKSKEIWLEVHEANNAAIHFYRKMGFSQVGERPRYYPDNGKAILMALKPIKT